MSLKLTASPRYGPGTYDIEFELFCGNDRIAEMTFECKNAEAWEKLVAASNDDTRRTIRWKDSYISAISHSIIFNIEDTDDTSVRRNNVFITLPKGVCREALKCAHQLAIENDANAR